MGWFLAVVIIGFLVYAGGRETKWGGLGLLWRVAAWTVGIGVLGFICIVAYSWIQDTRYEKQQAVLNQSQMEADKKQQVWDKFYQDAEQKKKNAVEKVTQDLNEKAQAEKMKKEAAKEAFQIKWGYTDEMLQELSWHRIPTSYDLPTIRTLQGKNMGIGETSYCQIHAGKGCSVYGVNEWGVLWIGQNEKEIVDVIETDEEIHLVWLIDSNF